MNLGRYGLSVTIANQKLILCVYYCNFNPIIIIPLQNLWIERITYTTDSYLPGILKWFEVVEQTMEQVCPAQYACEVLEKNNQQIRQMINHYRSNPHVNYINFIFTNYIKYL